MVCGYLGGGTHALCPYNIHHGVGIKEGVRTPLSLTTYTMVWASGRGYARPLSSQHTPWCGYLGGGTHALCPHNTHHGVGIWEGVRTPLFLTAYTMVWASERGYARPLSSRHTPCMHHAYTMHTPCMHHVGLARTVYTHCIYAPYMTVCMEISLLSLPHVHRIYV